MKREDSGDDERDDAYNEQPRITYETQWMSDEEGDAEELAELLNDSVRCLALKTLLRHLTLVYFRLTERV